MPWNSFRQREKRGGGELVNAKNSLHRANSISFGRRTPECTAQHAPIRQCFSQRCPERVRLFDQRIVTSLSSTGKTERIHTSCR